MLPALNACARRGLIRALDTLRENKGVERRVMKLRTASAKLNDRINGRSNYSLNPTPNQQVSDRELAFGADASGAG
jgi:hypothetical protein